MAQPIDETLIRQALRRLNSSLSNKESAVDVIRQVGGKASPATIFQLAIDDVAKPTISELEAAHADTYRYHISEVLANKPGLDAAQACMDIMLMPYLCKIELRQPRAERWLREIACTFASEQPVDVLAELFLRHSEKGTWYEFF